MLCCLVVKAPYRPFGAMGGILSAFARQVVRKTRCSVTSVLTTPAGNPLPPVLHRTLHQQELGAGRLIVVGDVHGCLDELQQLLQQLQFKHGHDNLILVGDLVNKGPKSQQVVATVREWCQQGCTWVVRGNHDDAALAARRQLQRRLQQGQQPEMKQKYHWVGQMTPEDEQFLMDMPFSLTIQGYNVLVVHAGLVPDVPVQQQQLTTLTKARDVVQQPDGNWSGIEKPQEGSQPWAAAWRGPQHVFFGHDAKRRLQTCPHATGLDTGCVYGGQLTACVLPSLAELQQSSKQEAGTAAADELPRQLEQQPEQPGRSSSRVGVAVGALQGQLVSVTAAVAYEQPGRKSIEVTAKSPRAGG